MNAIRVIIVEDEWIVSEEIKEMLKTNGFHVVGQAEDAVSAMNLLEEHTVDVALLDINIKGSEDGIALAKKIVADHQCAIIFVTAFYDQAFLDRAKVVKPSAYIVKPYQPKNLITAIEMAINNQAGSSAPPKSDSFLFSKSIFLRDNHRYKKLAMKDILYAKAVGSYTELHTENGKYTLSINLKTFNSKIDNEENAEFFRVHRSFLVNLVKIDEFDGNRIFIGNEPIPISTNHKEELMAKFRFI